MNKDDRDFLKEEIERVWNTARKELQVWTEPRQSNVYSKRWDATNYGFQMNRDAPPTLRLLCEEEPDKQRGVNITINLTPSALAALSELMALTLALPETDDDEDPLE